MKKNSSAVLAMATMSLVYGSVLAGCSAAPDSPVTTTGGSSSEQMFTQTVVRFEADGTQNVTTNLVTAAQQRANHAMRVASTGATQSGRFAPDSLTHDTDCVLSSMELFDATDYEGNEICFYNSSSTVIQNADLATYYRSTCKRGVFYVPCDPWYESDTAVIQSYYVGNESACLSNSGTSVTSGSTYVDMCYSNDDCYGGYSSSSGSLLYGLEYLWLAVETIPATDNTTICYY
ncbi:MAG TPA: hypothetical protein VGL81_08060 [Polyangiaceae bacterium]|jgi:hypothetical protein